MKKIQSFLNPLLLILTITFSFQLKSQVLTPKINPQINKCGADEIHQQLLLTDPAYAQKNMDFENYLQTHNTHKITSVVYKVPVVVNVMHKGESVGIGTNVSDAAIQNAIKNMNLMYRKVAGTAYDGNGVDVEIEYVLAVRDPNGNCTNGINRISMTSNSAYMSNGVDRQSSGGITDAALKAVYGWDRDEYYNIWLISEIDNNEGGNGIQGYAYFASAHGMSIDGAVILSSNFTSGTSTTAAHEIGHSLNLYHTFQGDGSGADCPTDAVCGTSGDCCGDTPRHKRSASDCVSGTNSCTGGSTELYIHNYMDYSADLCQNMLTANQKTRMVSALTTTRASFLEENGNMGLVPVSTAGVDFESSPSVLCSTGQSISFTDKSSCVPNSYIPSSSFSGITYSWTVTNGTNVYTSTAQNPTITFTNTGVYNVTLMVTNAHGTTSLTKTGMVVVSSSSPIAGCTPTSQNASNFWQTVYKVSFNTFSNTTSQYINAAYTNLACSYNTIVTEGQSYNLSISANAEGEFGNESFEVYIDYDNNGVFANPSELVFSGFAPLGTLGTYTTNVTIPGTAVKNTMLRMRVIADYDGVSANERTCASSLVVGDVEDYGVYIKAAGCTAPTITGTTPNSRCGNGTVALGATASAGTVNWYTASSGGSSIATGTSYTTPSLTTTTTYYVDATNAGCTTASRTAVIATITPTVLPAVSIALTSGTNPNCAGSSVTFSATPTNGGTTPAYQWKVNGSNVGSNSATYASSALTNGQAVTCVLTSNATCPAPTTATSSAVTMTVNSIVVPSVSIAQTVGTNPMCSGASSTFSATPTNGGTTPAYQWKVNGSNVGSNSATYSSSALTNGQAVTCILTSNAACTSSATGASAAINMTVNATVVPSIIIAQTVGTNPMCSGASSTFTATPTNGGTTPAYQWKVNGSNVGSNSNTYSSSSLTNGQAVTCVLTSNANCAAPLTATSSAVTMTVNSSVVPSIVIAQTVGTNPMCSGSSVTFTATPTNGGTTPAYQWKVDGSNVGSNSATYSSSSLTNGQDVTCMLTSNSSCASTPTANSSAITMTVNTPPTVSASASPTVICSGSTTTLTASGATAYLWSTGATTSSIFVSPTFNTSYTVTGTTSGCSGMDVITVSVTALPTVSVSANLSSICSGSSSTLTASGATIYLWNTGETTTSIIVTPTLNTTYTVTGTNAFGCSNTATQLITVNAEVIPSVNINVNSNPILAGSNASFTASPSNGGTPVYQWKLNNGNVGANSSTYSNSSLVDGDVVSVEMTSNASCASPTLVSSNAITMTVTTGCSAAPISGPGGIGNNIDNEIWLDASKLNVTNGGLVSTWTDRSGNARSATQLTSSKRPIFLTNKLNGLPVIDFDGNLDYLSTSGISDLNTDHLSWFIVGSSDNNTHIGHMISSSYASGAGTGSSHLWKTVISTNGAQYASFARSSSTVTSSGTIGHGWSTGYHIISNVWNGTTDVNTGFMDGALSGSQSGATASPGGHITLRLGANSADGNQLFNGKIAEAIVFSRTLNDAQRIIVENYLGTKYNLALGNDIYAFESTNSVDAAGIGMKNDSTQVSAKGSLVEIKNPSSLDNDDFLMWAHNNAGTQSTTNDVPAAYVAAGGKRMVREWRADKTNDVGNVSVSFYLNNIVSGNPSSLELLVDNDGLFANATRISSNFSYDNTCKIATWDNVNLTDGQYFTIGTTDGSGLLRTADTDEVEFNGNNMSLENTVIIYPNPNNGEFTIELSSNRDVEITNILGEKIMTQYLMEGQSTINISTQPAGVYFVKISFDNKQQVIKIIKQN